MGRRGTKKRRNNAWVGGVIKEAPTLGVAQPATERRAAWTRRYVQWATYLFLPIIVITLLLALNITQNGSDSPSTKNVGMGETEIYGKNLAISTVQYWLAGEQPPLPGGYFVSWDRVEKQSRVTEWPAGKKEQLPAGTPNIFWTHYLTLADTSGRLYGCTVEVAETSGNLRVIGLPSITAQPPLQSGGAASQIWPGQVTYTIQDVQKQAIEVWAAAYVSGDPAVLRQTVQDPSATHRYLPIGPAKIWQTKVVAAAAAPGTPTWTENGQKNKNPDSLIVRVELALIYPGVDEEDTSKIPAIQLDALLDKASTGTPIVTSWGGPGTGPGLKTYSVAVTGVDDAALTQWGADAARAWDMGGTRNE